MSSASFAPLELSVYDRVMRSQRARPADDVVVIAIDEASRTKLGKWPWPADVHASLLDRLSSQGARVVAFSVPLDTSRSSSEKERLRAALALLESSNLGRSAQARQLRRLLEAEPRVDPLAQLARAIGTHGNVILPVEVRLGESADAAGLPARLLPTADSATLRNARAAAIVDAPAGSLIAAAAGLGHTYVAPDADGVLRSDYAGLRVTDLLVPSLGVVIAARGRETPPRELRFSSGTQLDLGRRTTSLGPSLTVNPRYPASEPQPFTQYPYWRVLAGELPAEALRDKVVLVGATDDTVPAAVTPHGALIAPLIATASTAASLLEATESVRPGFATALEWIVAAIVIGFAAFALPALGIAYGALAAVVLAFVIAAGEVGLLSSTHLWVRLMLPAVALLVAYGVHLIGELIRRANAHGETRESAAQLRNLGQTFQRQGQLDLAFETYRRAPLDAAAMQLLYSLGTDFERRRQLQKAANVYAYMATREPNYRDLPARRARVRQEPLTRPPATRPVAQEQPIIGPAQETAEDREPSTAPRPAGTRTLGRYEIERQLGKGAMGTVYLGRDPKINRVVAIKAIPLADEFEEQDLAEVRARFFREAEMAGRLNHPSIVTVYDAGEDQGLAYIAMEYLRGQHLSHFTDARRLLPCGQVLLLVARVADALYYAHRQNVVHRDIKPANIMFDPETDELKITDFGIARLTDTSRTKTGIVLGTPSFMSPEQLEGRSLDGRSDQFALGISLYQLLCGQLPFRADSMPRLMQKIATEPHVQVRMLRPDLPACIDEILDRALAKSADQRYPGCAELAAALRACAGPSGTPRAAEPQHEWLLP